METQPLNSSHQRVEPRDGGVREMNSYNTVKNPPAYHIYRASPSTDTVISSDNFRIDDHLHRARRTQADIDIYAQRCETLYGQLSNERPDCVIYV